MSGQITFTLWPLYFCSNLTGHWYVMFSSHTLASYWLLRISFCTKIYIAIPTFFHKADVKSSCGTIASSGHNFRGTHEITPQPNQIQIWRKIQIIESEEQNYKFSIGFFRLKNHAALKIFFARLFTAWTEIFLQEENKQYSLIL